jgi:hypothetical protein
MPGCTKRSKSPCATTTRPQRCQGHRVAAGAKAEYRAFELPAVLMLLEAVEGHRWAALYRLAINLGMREGELLGLTWSAIDFETGTFRIFQQLRRAKVKNGADAGANSFSRPPRPAQASARCGWTKICWPSYALIWRNRPKSEPFWVTNGKIRGATLCSRVKLGRRSISRVYWTTSVGYSKWRASQVSVSTTCAIPPPPSCWQTEYR